MALCAGFYGLWRFVIAILEPLPTWCGALLIVGALTAIAGIVYAIAQGGLRRFLGYSTIEHAGILLLGLGVAALGQSGHNRTLAAAGLLAAALDVCAHNLAKTLALIAVDRVETATGQRTIDPLGGLARSLPVAAAGLGVASLTLAAIPPLGGFSEWFTLERAPAGLPDADAALCAAVRSGRCGAGSPRASGCSRSPSTTASSSSEPHVARPGAYRGARPDPEPLRARCRDLVPRHRGPVGDPRARLRTRVSRLQSGRLSVYLLYIMGALVLALALIPILH